ncbi:MAG: response regulator [Nitrospirae bacterium]|jgi:DNA-binding response OmpR family regulator|nr:response regulator [Nitrospirota bacterium]
MKKILIVDDENALRLLVNATLEGEGFKILQAKNGHEAIMISQMEKPDLILLDLMMPGLSGMEALEVLRKSDASKTVPVIILTAKGQPEDREKALKMGANHFLTKPFSPLELLNLVESILK